MTLLPVTIVALVEDGQPPIVRCAVDDAHGRRHEFVEKLPIVSDVDELPELPARGWIACVIVADDVRADGRGVVTVDVASPWSCETVEGRTVLEVFAEQLERGGA